MIVLHLQIRKDGAIRAMVNMVNGGYVKNLHSTLFIEEGDAKMFYKAMFAAYQIEAIHVRVWREGKWQSPHNH